MEDNEVIRKRKVKGGGYFYNVGNNSRQGIEASYDELKLLAVLFNHKILNYHQIHKLYESMVTKTTIASLKTKWWRWSAYDVVTRLNPDGSPKTIEDDNDKTMFTNDLNLIRIGKMGVRILVQEGFLKEKDLDINLNSFFISNVDHYVGTQEVVTNTMAHFIKEDIKFNSFRPSKLSKHYITFSGERVTPDWVLEVTGRSEEYSKNVSNHQIINIEFDTGNMNLSLLRQKCERYAEIAKQNPKHQYIVLFSLLDDTYRTLNLYNSNGPKRIGNMKNELLITNEIHLPNLFVSVSHLKDTHEIAFNIVWGNKFNLIEINMEHEFKASLVNNKQFEYRVHSIPNESVYLPGTNKFLYADKAYSFSNKAGTERIGLAILIGQGDVKALNRLMFLSDSLQSGLYKTKVDKIIAIYPTKSQRVNDIFGIHFPSNVIFSDLETLKKAHKESINPVFYRRSSKYVSEVTAFEG